MTAESAKDGRDDAKTPILSLATREWLRISWRFALLIGVFSMLVYLDEAALDSAVMSFVADSSATAARIMLRMLGADVVSSGNIITYQFHVFSVTPECTGYEVLQLFAAAVISAPLPWALRFRGLATGLPILILINLTRIMSLVFFSARWPEIHDAGHLYTWPAIMITVALGLWLTWINGAYARLARVQAAVE